MKRLNRRGAITVITMLVFTGFLLAFTAIVVDVGILYSARKQMLTAADAAALAGAKEMEKSLGVTDGTSLAAIRSRAISIATDIAIENGSDEDVSVEIKYMNIQLSDGTYDNRQVIEVKTVREKGLLFFQFLDKYAANVRYRAVATWGYVRTLRSGQILPLFLTTETYQDAEALHDGNMTFNDVTYPNQTGFIYIDPAWNGQNIINKSIAGDPTKINLEIGTEFKGKPGVAQSAISAVEDRFRRAQTLAEPEDRREFMYGLVPIVQLVRTQGNTLYFEIDSFAVAEIVDVMVAKNKGSAEALFGAGYTRAGVSRIYNPQVEGRSYDKGAIKIQLTGEVRQIEVVIRDNDQSIDPEIPDAAKYSKLVL